MGWLGSALPACSTSSRLSAFYTLSTSTIRSKSCLRQPSTTYIPPRSVLALASIPPALQESSLSFSPVAFTETALILAQSSTGLPWWLTIIGFTTALRLTITFPLAVQQRRRMARLASLAPVIKAWEATFRQMLKRRGGPEGVSVAEVKSLYRNKTRELFKTYNCHPIKTIILPLAQIPLWITTSLALRRMAAFPSPWLDTPSSPVDGFTTGGTSFFVDLSATDPTMIFPIAIGAMYLMNVELNNALLQLRGHQGNILVTGLFRLLALVMIPIATQVPMALNLLWASSAGFSIVQNLGFWMVQNRARSSTVKVDSKVQT